jgi:hypothetical protein
MTEVDTKSKPKAKKAPRGKAKEAKSDAPVAGPAWLGAPQIQKLIETGQRDGSLNSEEITTALNQAVEALNLESASDDFETLMKLLEARGVEIADLAEDEVIDDDEFSDVDELGELE